MASISGVYFNGSDEDVYVEAVRRNVEHGLPLSIQERKAAAARIFVRNGHWSDRRVASICGLSPSTVGEVRQRTAVPQTQCPSDDAGQLDARLGQDGRTRPVDAGAVRRRILEVVSQDPTASLRSVALIVGTSPETVRSVRERMRSHVSTPTPDAAPAQEVPEAFNSTPRGQDFFAWFTRTKIGPDDWAIYGHEIARDRACEVADEARRRASRWHEFADCVEGRAR
jgi:hypothetical protein